ncbi:MAG: hypothetical protein WCV50_01870 [Patescibacteria group bacterium]|jgi:hypothetical protein
MIKIRIIQFTAIILIIFIAVFFIIRINTDNKFYDTQGSNLISLKYSYELTIKANNRLIAEQNIYSTNNDLAIIKIPIKSSEKISLNLKLSDSKEKTVLREKTANFNPANNQAGYITWKFEPLGDSQGKTYSFQIQKDSWPTDASLLAVPSKNSDSGQLLVNGIADTDYRLALDWRYYAPSSLSVLVNRLTYAKSGIFYSKSFLPVIFIIFLLLTVCLLWLLVKYLFIETHD